MIIDSLQSERLCDSIVGNDEESKYHYFRYMDFWKKSFTLDWDYSDGDSMQYHLNELRRSREVKMGDLDSITRKRLYWSYIEKQDEWSYVWCCMNNMKMTPLLVY